MKESTKLNAKIINKLFHSEQLIMSTAAEIKVLETFLPHDQVEAEIRKLLQSRLFYLNKPDLLTLAQEIEVSNTKHLADKHDIVVE